MHQKTDSENKRIVLTAALRVKNEEANLPRCLANLERFCDHIVAYDDGSTDRTLQILKSHPKVRHVVSFEKDFYHETMDRSIALALAALTEPDWILRIDADEEFEERAVEIGARTDDGDDRIGVNEAGEIGRHNGLDKPRGTSNRNPPVQHEVERLNTRHRESSLHRSHRVDPAGTSESRQAFFSTTFWRPRPGS